MSTQVLLVRGSSGNDQLKLSNMSSKIATQFSSTALWCYMSMTASGADRWWLEDREARLYSWWTESWGRTMQGSKVVSLSSDSRQVQPASNQFPLMKTGFHESENTNTALRSAVSKKKPQHPHSSHCTSSQATYSSSSVAGHCLQLLFAVLELSQQLLWLPTDYLAAHHTHTTTA